MIELLHPPITECKPGLPDMRCDRCGHLPSFHDPTRGVRLCRCCEAKWR